MKYSTLLTKKTNLPDLQIVEEEAAKRIELLVKKRVEEEMERRKDEIEDEINKRIAEQKQKMEDEMMLELEKRREEIRAEEQRREVKQIEIIKDL